MQFMEEHPVISDLFKYREFSKRVSTYGETFLNYIHPVDERIHSSFQQLGADSGRMSSNDPNLQNIPHEQDYRTPFEAQREDWRIISADYSSQELRVLAQLSKEPAWLDAIKNKRDLHKMVASMMFRVPYDKVTKDLRTKAKTIGFGTIYGLSAYGLAKQLKISPDEGKSLLDSFFKAFPHVHRFLKQMERRALETKIAYSPLDGRIRDLSSVDWDDWRKRKHALNIAKNHPIQGASASITKLGLVLILKEFLKRNFKAKIIGVIHDEILVECPLNEAEEATEIVKSSMIKSFNHYCPDVPMEVEPVIARHWVH